MRGHGHVHTSHGACVVLALEKLTRRGVSPLPEPCLSSDFSLNVMGGLALLREHLGPPATNPLCQRWVCRGTLPRAREVDPATAIAGGCSVGGGSGSDSPHRRPFSSDC